MYVPFTSFVQVSSRFIFCLFNEKTREQFVVKRATFKTKVTRKQGMPNFPKKEHFLHPHMHTYVCASEGKKCSSSENLALCFLVTSVLRFAILPYYRCIKTILQVLNYKREQGSADNPVFCERMSLRSKYTFKRKIHTVPQGFFKFRWTLGTEETSNSIHLWSRWVKDYILRTSHLNWNLKQENI